MSYLLFKTIKALEDGQHSCTETHAKEPIDNG